MATRTVTVYTCDRCGAEYGPPLLPDPGSKEGAPVVLFVSQVHRSGVDGKEVIGRHERADLCTACADGLAAYLASGETLTLNLEHVGDAGQAITAAARALGDTRRRLRIQQEGRLRDANEALKAQNAVAEHRIQR